MARARAVLTLGKALLGLLLLGLTLAALDAAANYRQDHDRWAACASNLRVLSLALGAYEAAHGGRLPHADTWADDLRPYVSPGAFHCPADGRAGGVSYALNRRLGGRRVGEIADAHRTVLLYEADLAGADPCGAGGAGGAFGRHRYPRPGASYRASWYLFADGTRRFPEDAAEARGYHW